MTKCPKCRSPDVVWVNDLKTYKGTSPGVLCLYAGTIRSDGLFRAKVCRACGFAELFLKDPKFLVEPPHPLPEGYVTPTEEEPEPQPVPRRTPARSSRKRVATESPTEGPSTSEGTGEAPSPGHPAPDT